MHLNAADPPFLLAHVLGTQLRVSSGRRRFPLAFRRQLVTNLWREVGLRGLRGPWRRGHDDG